MKTPLFGLLLVFATALAADTPALSGKWQVHTAIAGTENDQVCTFAQKEDTLTGSCSSDHGDVVINGKVSGKKMNWSYKSEYNGSPLTVAYEGTLDSAKIVGSVSVPEFGVDGDFTAIPAK